MDKIPLLPVDYVFTGEGSQPITFAFSYRATLDPELLANGLRQVAEHMRPLQSRLFKTSETDYEFRVDPDPLVIDVRSSSSRFEAGTKVEQYIAPVRSLEGEPLTRIALTQTPGGSVLAVSISHALVDGFSFFHFLSSWARTCRPDRLIIPSLEREPFLSQIDRTARDAPPESFTDQCGLFHGGRREPSRTIREERFFLSDESIKSALEGARQGRGQSMTENDVIAALLWQKYLPQWLNEAGNPRVYLTLPFDFRRVMAGFPKSYFGCALCFATASSDRQSLINSSAGDLALLVRSAVSRMRSEQILRSMSTLDAFRRNRGLAAVEELHLRHPASGMIVTNLTRMPIGDIDFGSGAPADYSAYLEVSRGAAILPGSGGVNILIGHPSD
jgi:hypothetical protein